MYSSTDVKNEDNATYCAQYIYHQLKRYSDDIISSAEPDAPCPIPDWIENEFKKRPICARVKSAVTCGISNHPLDQDEHNKFLVFLSDLQMEIKKHSGNLPLPCRTSIQHYLRVLQQEEGVEAPASMRAGIGARGATL